MRGGVRQQHGDVAVGAVMVYSASAPSTLSGGSGAGTLIRFAAYGLVGLVLLHIVARTGLDTVRRLTGPLLAVAFVYVWRRGALEWR